MRAITAGALLAVLLAACAANSDSSDPTVAEPSSTLDPGSPAKLVRVLDGDSLIVTVDSREQEVRLIGINAPEGSECYGDEAKRQLEELVAVGDLSLITDGEDTDQYGRLLRYLLVDGVNVNQQLVAAGMAIALQGTHSNDAEFAAISDHAAADRVGLWATDACSTDVEIPDVAVTGYSYDPNGRDENNMVEEWIELTNDGTQLLDLAGWVLRDESTQNRYRFPDGTVLAPRAAVTVHTGCGSDSATDLYWCADGPVWSNGGDTVIVQLPDGTVVARTRYTGG